MRAIDAHNRENGAVISAILVHTGQHYDDTLSDSFFRDLSLHAPDVHLGVGSGTHAEQTGKVMIAFEKVLLAERPELVIVVGDVNSTMACTLAAVKLHVPVAHVEAGLRSFDRRMPEEINRIVTDALSEYLFTPSADGDENLLREGISQEKIFLVGDIMVDSLLFHKEEAENTGVLARLGLQDSRGDAPSVAGYALLTLHRPSNVDVETSFRRIIDGLLRVSAVIPVIFPVHPRTKKQIGVFGLEAHFTFHETFPLRRDDYYETNALRATVHCLEPLGYLEFLNLMTHAKLVLTDSGGIQEETTVLGIPCITLRDTTERPVTVTEGTNALVHDDPEKIVRAVADVVSGHVRRGRRPAIWDGHTAERIVRILAAHGAPKEQ